MATYSNSEIMKVLSTINTTKNSLIEKLKIRLRPLIAPFEPLLKPISKDSRVFDIGCGQGQFLAVVAELTPAETMSGIEINENLVETAQEVITQIPSNKNISVNLFNGVDIPDDIRNYNLIYLIDVIHHVPQERQQAFIKSIYKKMAPNSRLLIKDINKGNPLVFFNKIHDLVFSGEVGHEVDYRFLEKFLMELGFQIEESFTRRVFCYPHYFIIAKKGS